MIRCARRRRRLRFWEIVRNIKPPTVGGIQPEITCQIGINQGAAFVAEVGEPRGRREFQCSGRYG